MTVDAVDAGARGSARRLRVRRRRTAARRSATTPPGRTTCCRPAARRASPARSAPSTFRRRTAIVHLASRPPRRWRRHVDALARAEGFPVHGESARARAEAMDNE